MNDFERIEQITEELATLLEKVKDKTGEYLYQIVKPVFEKYPMVQSVGTPAYSPYFNDGEACEWSHSWDDPYCWEVNGFNCENWEEDECTLTVEQLEEIQEMLASTKCPNWDILKNFCEDGLIIINRDGTVSVEEYSHD